MSILVLDSDRERATQLSLLLRLAGYPYHIVGSAEEACNHVATCGDAHQRYRCLLVNGAVTTEAANRQLETLDQHRFTLPVVLVERFPHALRNQLLPHPELNLRHCTPDAISATLTDIVLPPSLRDRFAARS